MNGNIVAVVLPDLDPVHQLGNYQIRTMKSGCVTSVKIRGAVTGENDNGTGESDSPVLFY